MSTEHKSSENLDEAAIAVLMACQQRGPLTAEALGRLVEPLTLSPDVLPRLSKEKYLRESGGEFQISESGLQYLDGIFEAIQREFAPNDPSYVRRYRREKPSLPFDANTIWAEAVCINVRVKPEELRPLIPSAFKLDLYDGWAYVSLTLSRLKNFGAGPIPNVFRMNFYQATYRAHVTFNDFRGESIRGCYFLRSETNSPLMSLAANLLPEFKAHQFKTHPILMVRNGDRLVLTVDSNSDPAGQVVMVLDTAHELLELPKSSRFKSIHEAYAYIVDFHDAFSIDPETGEVFILKIERGEWRIKVLEPIDYYLGYFSKGTFPNGSAELDSVFYFRDTPYRWLPLLKERIPASNERKAP